MDDFLKDIETGKRGDTINGQDLENNVFKNMLNDGEKDKGKVKKDIDNFMLVKVDKRELHPELRKNGEKKI